MLQLGFREVGVRIGEIDNLIKIAHALREGGGSQIMVYFEFDDAGQLLFFCNAVKVISDLREMAELESRKRELQNEILELEGQRLKLGKEI